MAVRQPPAHVSLPGEVLPGQTSLIRLFLNLITLHFHIFSFLRRNKWGVVLVQRKQEENGPSNLLFFPLLKKALPVGIQEAEMATWDPTPAHCAFALS